MGQDKFHAARYGNGRDRWNECIERLTTGRSIRTGRRLYVIVFAWWYFLLLKISLLYISPCPWVKSLLSVQCTHWNDYFIYFIFFGPPFSPLSSSHLDSGQWWKVSFGLVISGRFSLNVRVSGNDRITFPILFSKKTKRKMNTLYKVYPRFISVPSSTS